MRGLLPVALAASLVAACSGGGNESGDAGEQGPLRMQVSGDQEETAAFEALAVAYGRSPGGRRVELRIVEDEEDHLAKLAVSAAGDDAPDLFVVGYRAYTALAQSGAVVPAEPLLRRRGVDVSSLERAPIEAFSSEGTLQCLPMNASSMVVYWNRSLFEDAGVATPAAGWTWADFEAAAVALTRDGVRGVGIAPRLIRLAPFIWSAGGEIVDDELKPTGTTIATPAGLQALELFARLLLAEAIPSAAERTSENMETTFARGRLGMYLSSRRDVPRFREATSLDWDVATVPVAPGGAATSILHSDGACVSRQGSSEAAADFLAYLASAEAQSLAALSGRFVPVLPAARPAFLDPARPPASARVFIDQLERVRRVPLAPRWSAAETRADEVLERMWADAAIPVSTIAEDVDRETARVLSR